MTKKVTMAQIAAKAGISQPTVSLVLNGNTNARISESTRRRVIEVARELGYRKAVVHFGSDQLRVALILDGSIITHDHFVQALNEAAVRANELDLSLCILDALQDKAGRRRVQDEVNSGHYAGAIIATNVTCGIDFSYELRCPCVYLNCVPENDIEVTAVLPDDYATLHRLAGELLEKYHRPCIIAGDAWMSATTKRIRAIARAAFEQGIEIGNDSVYYTSWSFKLAFEAVRKVMTRPEPERPDILFCASDYLAAAAYQAVYVCGLKIPGDVAVCGYDNQSLSEELTPTLTTVDLPYDEMGAMAVDLIYRKITKPDEQPKQNLIRVKGEIFRRESA